MIVRQFTKNDARACCGVINSCITAMTDIDAPSRFYLLSSNDPVDFYRNIKDDYALVAELHGQIVAIGALRNNKIHTVHVSPDFQGNGIGETLIVSLEAEAQSHGVEIIQVEAEASSIEFYEQMGYKKLGKSHTRVKFTTLELTKMQKKLSTAASV